jgi:hypothetical protein
VSPQVGFSSFAENPRIEATNSPIDREFKAGISCPRYRAVACRSGGPSTGTPSVVSALSWTAPHSRRTRAIRVFIFRRYQRLRSAAAPTCCDLTPTPASAGGHRSRSSRIGGLPLGRPTWIVANHSDMWVALCLRCRQHNQASAQASREVRLSSEFSSIPRVERPHVHRRSDRYVQ